MSRGTTRARSAGAAPAHGAARALLVALSLLAACADGDPRTRATPTATPVPPASASPSSTGTPPRPSATPAPIESATASASATPTYGRAVLAVGGAIGVAGETVQVTVSLAEGANVAGLENDIAFPPEIAIAARDDGRPDCTVNPAIGREETSFAFQPALCTPGRDCTAVRVRMVSLGPVGLIPVGPLYTCRVAIADSAATGPYTLRCAQAASSDPNGNALTTTCTDGGVLVEFVPTPTPTPRDGAAGAVAPLAAAGRWLVDDLGRVVLLHGVNMVAKRAPYHPAGLGFGADDAAFLAAEGFTALRLGVDFRGLMPAPGVVEADYIERLAETVDALAAHGLFVLLDFHQDGFAPMFNGNGLPDWMAITDGLPNPPDAVFPLYYIQNPAMQRAFESFWANRPGPGGIGLQEYFVQGVEAVAARFADQPLVLGTELMNEPFPGAEWMACALDADGCPELEQARLVPFYQRGAAAARRAAPAQMVFVEPFVLFNFGQADTSLPGRDQRLALAFHSYALDVAGEEGVVARAVAAAERDQRPLLCTEFGASTDPVLLDRLTAQLERALVPWLFWTYDEAIIADLGQPAGPENLRSREALAVLTRPYPVAIAGTPTEVAFDAATGRFRLAYDRARPGGGAYADAVVTVVSVPARHYPDGYTVTAAGAEVTSAAHAPLLTLRARSGAASVSVGIAPTSPGAVFP